MVGAFGWLVFLAGLCFRLLGVLGVDWCSCLVGAFGLLVLTAELMQTSGMCCWSWGIFWVLPWWLATAMASRQHGLEEIWKLVPKKGYLEKSFRSSFCLLLVDLFFPELVFYFVGGFQT